MLPRQVVTYGQLRKAGLLPTRIWQLGASLRLFPTPFKGIYYIPSEEERSGWFIDKPLRALTLALSLFLSGSRFYYSCATAAEASGADWRPSGEFHVVNEKLSARIDLAGRAKRNLGRKTYRSGKIARLLSFYGGRLVFHKVRSIEGAKTRQTPYGRFALASQIRKDRKRFREQ